MAFIPDEETKRILYSQFFLDKNYNMKLYIKNEKGIRSQRLKNKSAKIKKQLIEEKGSCEVCGYSFKPILQLHHILPINKYGNNDRDNLVCVCPNCHKVLHHIYKKLDDPDDDSIMEEEVFYREYTLSEIRKINKILEVYLTKSGEVYDFIKNFGSEDTSEE